MKQIITKDEVQNLSGKFVVQLNNDTPNKTIDEGNWGFWEEKRISLIVGRSFHGFYYTHHSCETDEEFAEYFNNYVDNNRFHRLLTSKEIDFLCKKLKENNY